MSVPLGESLLPMKSTTDLNDMILYSVISSVMSRILAPRLECFRTPAIMPLGLIGFKIESPMQSLYDFCFRTPAGILCHLL